MTTTHRTVAQMKRFSTIPHNSLMSKRTIINNNNRIKEGFTLIISNCVQCNYYILCLHDASSIVRFVRGFHGERKMYLNRFNYCNYIQFCVRFFFVHCFTVLKHFIIYNKMVERCFRKIIQKIHELLFSLDKFTLKYLTTIIYYY